MHQGGQFCRETNSFHNITSPYSQKATILGLLVCHHEKHSCTIHSLITIPWCHSIFHHALAWACLGATSCLGMSGDIGTILAPNLSLSWACAEPFYRTSLIQLHYPQFANNSLMWLALRVEIVANIIVARKRSGWKIQSCLFVQRSISWSSP